MSKKIPWEPEGCPKNDGHMAPILGMDDAWKCETCGLEIWDGDIPTANEYENLIADRMILQSASYKPHVSRSFVEGTIPKKGGTKSGRSRKKGKKVDLQNRYRMILSEKNRE